MCVRLVAIFWCSTTFFFQQKLLYVNILASSELGGLYSGYIVLRKVTKENIILNFGAVCSVFAFSSWQKAGSNLSGIFSTHCWSQVMGSPSARLGLVTFSSMAVKSTVLEQSELKPWFISYWSRSSWPMCTGTVSSSINRYNKNPHSAELF